MTELKIDGFEKAASHSIVRNTPSVNFFEGALLGNGALGVVVCVRPDAVMLHFGHNNVWDIRLAEDNIEKMGTFKEIFNRINEIPKTEQNLLDNEWYKSYHAMAQENYAKPYPRPFPCGTLVLGFDRRKVEALGYHLSIANGVCSVNFLVENKPSTLHIFTEMDSDLVWLKMTDEKGNSASCPFDRVKLIPDPDTPNDIPKYSTQTDAVTSVLSFRQIMPFLEPKEGKPASSHKEDKAFRVSVKLSDTLGKEKLLPANGVWKDMDELEFKVTPSGKRFLAVVQLSEGLATDICENTNNPLPSLKEDEAFAIASSSSLKIWKDYWSRSAVSLHSPLLEQTWYRNLYFLNCSAKAGVTCPGLFANWSYRKIGTPWHGDYHMNYNTQQPFWVTFSSNHVEKHEPYVQMIHNVLPMSCDWAKDYYEMRGAFTPHSLYPVHMTTNPYAVPDWGWEIFETPWAVQSLWWHYLYTQDLGFLKERVFLPLQQATLFVIDYMTRPEAHGSQWNDDCYHVFPTVSPELYGMTPGFRVNSDGLSDLTLIKFMFNAFRETCKILKCEQSEQGTLEQVSEILNHYPEYPTADTEAGKIYLSIKGQEPEIVYNCPANTVTVFPGEEHGLHSSKQEYDLALNSYRHQQNEGGNDLVFLNLQAARLGVLDLDKFERQIVYCSLPNGTQTDMVLQTKGRYSDTTPFDWMGTNGIWFENFALPVVINECLMQSYNGIIRLFPNWPMDKNAAFSTLRAVGAFLVSSEFKEGEITEIEIFSECGGTCKLYNPWFQGVVSVSCTGSKNFRKDVPSKTENDILSFETSAGMSYLIINRK